MVEVATFQALRVAATAGELARAVTAAAIAPTAAAGWGARTDRKGWDVSVGASGSGSPIFDLASLTKPMTALAVARSGLDRGVSLGDLLAEARGTPSEGVSLELLLAHRAGLEAHLDLFSSPQSDILHVAAMARRPDACGPLPPEGAAPIYSDLGYLLVGEALARHVGARDAGEAIESLVVSPLGLADALGTARALIARAIDFDERVVATELVPWRGGTVRGRVHDENAWVFAADGGAGHAGMFGTCDAVVRFAAAALDAIVHDEGPLATPDLAWLARPRPGGDLRAGFDGKSLTGESSAGELAGPRTFGHLGFTGTSFWIDPDADAVVVLLTNRVHPTRENLTIRAARPIAHDTLWRLARRARFAHSG